MRKEAILPCDVGEEVGGLLGDAVGVTSLELVVFGVLASGVAVEGVVGASVDPASKVTT